MPGGNPCTKLLVHFCFPATQMAADVQSFVDETPGVVEFPDDTRCDAADVYYLDDNGGGHWDFDQCCPT